MSAAPLLSSVSAKLHVGERLIFTAEASLVEDLVKNKRVVAIINHTSDDAALGLHAFLIFQVAPGTVPEQNSLALEWTIPVDSHFKYFTENLRSAVASEVFIKISYKSKKFLLEMPAGPHVNQLVAEIHRASSVSMKRREAPLDFQWIQTYVDTSLYNVDDNETVLSKMDSLTEKSNVVYNAALRPASTPITPRESVINHHMSLQEHQYMNINDYKVFVGTWNVNGQHPSVDLSDWLSVDEEPPDIYAIGFQELDLTKEAYVFTFTPREQQWLNAVLNAVHPRAGYKKVRLVRLVGMMLVVLVQEKHVAYVSNIAVNTVGTGIMNKLGNKGAVSIRMDFYNTSICFVNVHMAAHQDQYERRNEDHDCILQRTVFNTSIQGPPKQISDHDHIYFFGDMNYRINPGQMDIKYLASKGHLSKLLENDQLLHFKHIKRIFQDYCEAPISFKPTYKYDLNTDDWYNGEKMRLPAWCDRILWSGQRMENVDYRSHASLRISDHKPVSALFQVGVKELDPKRYNKIYEEVMKKIDKLENECLPQVVVDTNEIIFESVKFLQPQTKVLTIENTGQVPVSFQFIKKLDDANYCKPWLNIRPWQGFLNPAGKCLVTLEVCVDKKTASKLTCGSEQLYDILVLHLEHGKDIFITVNGDYVRSSFGSSINALVHIRKPFNDVPVSQLLDLESPNPSILDESPYGIPKEIWYFIDNLYSKSMLEEGLFTTSGLKKEIEEIRDCLDAGVPEEPLPGNPHSVAEALLLFLDALREPVIPYAFYSRALNSAANYSACEQLVAELPVHHRNVFSHLMAFLREILRHSEDNLCDADNLALVFGPILVRDPRKWDAGNQNTPEDRKKQTFIHHFLVNG